MTHTFLSADWKNLIMANHEVNPEVLTAYFPLAVEQEFYNNKPHLSLVGFYV